MREYFDEFVIVVDESLCYVHENRERAGFICYWGFGFVVVDEVDVVGKCRESSPEEEAIDPPADRVPVLL